MSWTNTRVANVATESIRKVSATGASPKATVPWLLVISAPEEIRTPNLLIRSQMLYPLSYGRFVFSYVLPKNSAEARGFEPPVPLKGDNSLAVSPIRPLWHASMDFTRVPEPLPGSRNRRGHSVHSRDICCRSERPPAT